MSLRELSTIADDAQVIARAREVANLSQYSIESGYGPSDVGDVVVRWLIREMSLSEVLESLDDLAIDYKREAKGRRKY